jgi:hypothetical protein
MRLNKVIVILSVLLVFGVISQDASAQRLPREETLYIALRVFL